jgi:antitoxin FitA
MPAVTVRNIPDATHRALRLRAAQAGRSTEAEIRYILEEAVQPALERLKVGDAIHQIAMKYGGFELELPKRTDLPEPAVFD